MPITIKIAKPTPIVIWSRSHKRFKEAIQGVPHERFRRIVGLFDAVVPIELKQKSDGQYENPVTAVFERLQEKIQQNLEILKAGTSENFPTKEHLDRLADETSDLIHNLHLLLAQLLPAEALQYGIITHRAEYRTKVSDAVFVSYETSEIRRALDKPDLDPPERLRLLRAEYTHLVNELRQISIADYHVENARGELMRKLTWTYLATLVIPALSVIAFSVANWCIPKHQSIFYPLLLLSYCGAPGATGAYISTLLRIEALPESWANAHNLAVLRYSHSLYAVPLTGLVFGIVLSLIISGDLLAGALFPKQGEWYTAVNTARFLAWGFIAGFAERLIPDVIDRLAQNARRLDTQTQK